MTITSPANLIGSRIQLGRAASLALVLLSTTSIAAEDARVARHQFWSMAAPGLEIDLRGYLATAPDMSRIYALDCNSEDFQCVDYDIRVFERIRIYGVEGYTIRPEGPVGCEFEPHVDPERAKLTVSADGNWAGLVWKSGPSYLLDDWDNQRVHGAVVDLTQPDRGCSSIALFDAPAAIAGDIFFAGDSQTLLFGLPYQPFPIDAPEPGITRGQLRRYALDQNATWSLETAGAQIFDGAPNQNVGFATTVVASRDASVVAASVPARRLKESETQEDRFSLLGYIPEDSQRHPDLPGIDVMAGGGHQYFPFPLQELAAYRQVELFSVRDSGAKLASSKTGDRIVSVYQERIREQSYPVFVYTLDRGEDGWQGEAQSIPLVQCTDPEAQSVPNVFQDSPLDLKLSDDGERLAILTVGLGGGICLLTREEGQWLPLHTPSHELKGILTEFGYSNFNRLRLQASSDLSRMLLQMNDRVLQFDLDWQEEPETSGLPIWLLYEATREQ